MPFFAEKKTTKRGELLEIQLAFGEGDIGIAAATAAGKKNTVALFSLEACDVPGWKTARDALGKTIGHAMSTDEMAGPVIRMEFSRVESVDALVHALTEVRDALIAEQKAKAGEP